MTPTRLRLSLALIFALISLTLLAWSLWPQSRTLRRQFFQPTEMQLPAEDSRVPAGKPA